MKLFCPDSLGYFALYDHTATHCNALPNTATYCNTFAILEQVGKVVLTTPPTCSSMAKVLQYVAVFGSALQCVAVPYNKVWLFCHKDKHICTYVNICIRLMLSPLCIQKNMALLSLWQKSIGIYVYIPLYT